MNSGQNIPSLSSQSDREKNTIQLFGIYYIKLTKPLAIPFSFALSTAPFICFLDLNDDI